MAGTMGNFWVGVSGLQSSQYALNTTSHNITNAGTAGYSRQQVLLTDLSYTNMGRSAIGLKQSGLGTRIADVRLVRDRFMDRAYRTEVGREQYYITKYDVVAEVQNYFGEMESSTFSSYMENLWKAAQELQQEPNSIVRRSAYIARVDTLVDQANEIYKQLTTYQNNLNEEITDQVDRINKLADIIKELNDKITAVEAAKIESANDYRDQRDAALDELAGIISISYKENSNGQVDVYAENRNLVSMDRVFRMGTKQVSEDCDYLMPIWEDDQEAVFNMHYDKEKDPRYNDNVNKVAIPCPENETDTGSLKGIIMSRGDWVMNYTDIPIAPIAPERPIQSQYMNEQGVLDQSKYDAAMDKYAVDYQQYQTDYEAFVKERDFYNIYIEPYTVGNIIAQFDQMIHRIVTKINDILCPNKEITVKVPDPDADPDDPNPQMVTKTIKVLDEEKAGYGIGEGNQVQGTELIKRSHVERYTTQTVTVVDENGNEQEMTVQVYNEENPDDYSSLYTIGNIEINDELVKNPSLLPMSNLQQEELQGAAEQLIHMWSDKIGTLGPNSLVEDTFLEYYKEFVGDFANKGYTYNGIAESQTQAVLEADNQRQTVVGVSTDEELSNLIKFQQGFNASSRYFSVVSEMVEHLINKLG
ncbi:MAG: flagellar hook-associated protein FlgK [Lachnospiraceae bacterium]|nr:flagellar hook-associated protein FlgK [Lachnospiraceae bacterium]